MRNSNPGFGPNGHAKARVAWWGVLCALVLGLAPGMGSANTAEEVRKSVEQLFTKMDSDGDGLVDFDELEEGVEGQLPKDTEYKSLIAQVGARLTISALDVDEGSKQVKDRKISRAEWSNAAATIQARLAGNK